MLCLGGCYVFGISASDLGGALCIVGCGGGCLHRRVEASKTMGVKAWGGGGGGIECEGHSLLTKPPRSLGCWVLGF